MKKIFSVIFAVIFAVGLALPLAIFGGGAKNAFAQTILYATILSPEVENVDSIVCNVDDKAYLNLSDYVPYDSNGDDLNGKAVLANGKIRDLQFTATDDASLSRSSVALENSDVSIVMWLFLPDTNLDSIQVRLSGTNEIEQSVSLSITVPASELYTDQDDSLVPGWRKLEIFMARSTANIDGKVLYKDLNKFTIIAEEGYSFAVFGIELRRSTAQASAVEECGIYCEVGNLNVYSFVLVDSNFVNNNCVSNKMIEDRISVPAGSDVFRSAYLGGQRITTLDETIDSGKYYWGTDGEKHALDEDADCAVYMKVTNPSGTSKYYKITSLKQSNVAKFDVAGNWKLRFVVRGQVGDDMIDFAQSTEYSIDVKSEVKGFNLDTTGTTVYSGNTYKYYFSVDTNYYTLSKNDIDVRSSNAKVLEIVDIVVYDGGNGGYVEVRANKGGRARVVFETRLLRTGGGEVKEENSAIAIRSFSTEDNSEKVVKIVLMCVFAVCTLGGLAYAIYAIVKHNRMGVK